MDRDDVELQQKSVEHQQKEVTETASSTTKQTERKQGEEKKEPEGGCYASLDSCLIYTDEASRNESGPLHPSEKVNKTVKSILHDVVPSILAATGAQILMKVNESVVLICVSHFMPNMLAHYSVSYSVFAVCSASLVVGLSVAMETLASQAHGFDPKGKGVAHTAIFAAGFLTLCAMPLYALFFFGKNIWAFIFGDELATPMEEFLRASLPYLLCFAYRAVVNRCLIAQKRGEISLHAMFVSVSCLPFIAYYLIKEKGAELGLAAPALALASGVFIHIVAMIVLAWFRSTDENPTWIRQVARCSFTEVVSVFTHERLTHFLSLALPACGSVISQWWVTELAIILATRLPSLDQVAAVAISLQVTQMLFVVLLGCGMSISSAVGTRLGAGLAGDARACLRTCLFFAFLMAVFNSTVLAIFGDFVLKIYSGNNSNVEKLLRPLLPIMICFHIAEAGQTSLGAAFRGSAQLGKLMTVTVPCMWLWAVPCMWLSVAHFHWGPEGILLAFLSGFVLQLPILAHKIHNFDWVQLAKDAVERSSRLKHIIKQDEKSVVDVQEEHQNAPPPDATPSTETDTPVVIVTAPSQAANDTHELQQQKQPEIEQQQQKDDESSPPPPPANNVSRVDDEDPLYKDE